MCIHITCYTPNVIVCLKKNNGKQREKVRRNTFMAAKKKGNCYKEKICFVLAYLKQIPAYFFWGFRDFSMMLAAMKTLKIWDTCDFSKEHIQTYLYVHIYVYVYWIKRREWQKHGSSRSNNSDNKMTLMKYIFELFDAIKDDNINIINKTMHIIVCGLDTFLILRWDAAVSLDG